MKTNLEKMRNLPKMILLKSLRKKKKKLRKSIDFKIGKMISTIKNVSYFRKNYDEVLTKDIDVRKVL